MASTKTNSELCREGKIKKIPKGSLTEEDLIEESKNGVATIIYVILNNQLHLIPKELLTHKVLNQYDLLARSGYYLATEMGYFNDIPKKLITKEVLSQMGSTMHYPNADPIWAILIKNKNIEPVLPQLEEIIDKYEASNILPPLPTCALNGVLNKIPKEYFTEERVFRKTIGDDQTLLHHAAEGGTLDQIPKEFLTEESMSMPNKNGYNPIHLAAINDNLHQIPKEFLTEKFLKKGGDKEHFNAIQLTARHYSFKNFPEDLLTEENFKYRGAKDSVSPLTILCHRYCEAKAQTLKYTEIAFKRLLSNLSDTTLNELRGDIAKRNLPQSKALILKEFTKREIKSRFSNELTIDI
jgi:hypothetical protein